MVQFAGSCRFVYNKALALQKECYEADKSTKFSYYKLQDLLPIWKKEEKLEWLKDSPAQSLQQSLRALERSYVNFFQKRADFPKFKKRGVKDSFRYPQGKQIKLDELNKRIFLPKLGYVRYRNSRDIQGVISNVTVSLKAGKWFASIQTEREVAKSLPNASGIIGIDAGVVRFATFSDGSYLAPKNSFKKHEKRLKKAQQSLSRKRKFSSNWKKAKRRVQKIHYQIGNTRRDYLHKATTQISKNHAYVCIEDLKVSNMSKSAKGDEQKHGKNVKAKSGLNKAILDQGWFEFRRQLEYKLDWLGGELLTVNPKNTSRKCPNCGHTHKENRLSQAKFECSQCGYTENADVVGAINILRAGHAQLACQVNLEVKGQQQEPTEAIILGNKPDLIAVGIPPL